MAGLFDFMVEMVDNGWWMVDWETGDRGRFMILDFGFRILDGRGRWRGVSVFR
jgi:hypothetical protein